jgi:hypothetical protein
MPAMTSARSTVETTRWRAGRSSPSSAVRRTSPMLSPAARTACVIVMKYVNWPSVPRPAGPRNTDVTLTLMKLSAIVVAVCAAPSAAAWRRLISAPPAPR